MYNNAIPKGSVPVFKRAPRKASWPAFIAMTAVLAFPLTAIAGDKKVCLSQVKMAKSVVNLRLTGMSKQALIDQNRKLAVDNKATATVTSRMTDVTNRIAEIVYAADSDELDLVPGMIYAQCMR